MTLPIGPWPPRAADQDALCPASARATGHRLTERLVRLHDDQADRLSAAPTSHEPEPEPPQGAAGGLRGHPGTVGAAVGLPECADVVSAFVLSRRCRARPRGSRAAPRPPRTPCAPSTQTSACAGPCRSSADVVMPTSARPGGSYLASRPARLQRKAIIEHLRRVRLVRRRRHRRRLPSHWRGPIRRGEVNVSRSGSAAGYGCRRVREHLPGGQVAGVLRLVSLPAAGGARLATSRCASFRREPAEFIDYVGEVKSAAAG